MTASCTCGAFRIKATGGRRHVFCCHCTHCVRLDRASTATERKATAPTWTAVKRSRCEVLATPPAAAYTRHVDSVMASRVSCSSCGSLLFMDYEAIEPSTIWVANASFQQQQQQCYKQQHKQQPLGYQIPLEPDIDIFWGSRPSDRPDWFARCRGRGKGDAGEQDATGRVVEEFDTQRFLVDSARA